MDKPINLNEAREYTLKIVLQAGEILKGYFASRKFTSRSKGGVDVLTQADEETDKFLREALQKHFPQTTILTEETAPQDYSAFKELNNVWVIDPLDATVNFLRSNKHFAVSVGLVDKGISKMGVVYLPLEDTLYWAQADKSEAFCNDKPMKVSSITKLKETVLACDWGWQPKERAILYKYLKEIIPLVRQIKCANCAVAEPASLANGKIDAYLVAGIKPWDIAASCLFIRKAGGKITTPEGKNWDIFNPNMLATNGILQDKILELLK